MLDRKITEQKSDHLLLKIPGLRNVIAIQECNELLPIISKVFRDWNSEIVDVEHYPEPASIVLASHQGGYLRSSRWLEEPVFHADALDAVCDFSVDFFHAYVADNPGVLCLHAAAVRLGDGLMVFPAFYKSGKSLFSAHLAWLGVELFTDDALPLTPHDNMGVAMGVCPRLRLPLPENVDEEFRAFVHQNIAQINQQYCYLQLGHENLAKWGTTEKIGAITLLNRVDSQPAFLEEIASSDAMKELILRNFARQNKAIDIVDRFMKIAATAKCYRLTFSDLREAGEMLIDKFSNGSRA